MVERRRPAGQSPIVLTPLVESIQTPPTVEPTIKAEHEPAVVEAERKSKRSPRPAASAPAEPTPTPMPPAPEPKIARTFQFRDSLIKRAETAVLRTGGQGGHMSMTALLNAALERELQRLEAEFNDGAPFPANRGAFRTGRAIGS